MSSSASEHKRIVWDGITPELPPYSRRRMGAEVGQDSEGDGPCTRIRDVLNQAWFSVYCRARHERDRGSGRLAVLTKDNRVVTDVDEHLWTTCSVGFVSAMCMACVDLPAFAIEVKKLKAAAATGRSEVDVLEVAELTPRQALKRRTAGRSGTDPS